MKNVTGIQGGLAPTPPAGVEPREHASPEPAPSASPAAQPPVPAAPSREEIEAAVAELREQMAELPGSHREVNLLYEEEDRSFVVEIRNSDTGELIQQFPPEIVLNHRRGSADLLGTVIDRRS